MTTVSLSLLVQWFELYSLLLESVNERVAKDSKYFAKILIISITIYTIFVVVDVILIALAAYKSSSMISIHWLIWKNVIAVLQGIIISSIISLFIFFK